MDRRERLNDPEEALQAALDGRQAAMWTALPGIIQSFDAQKQTCVVQPALKGYQALPSGQVNAIDMPLLLDCPVQFPGSGGATLTFPVAEGDECLVVFASRCIDAWWDQGGIGAQSEFRMHDLSDGFALLGYRSKPNVITEVSTSTTQLRSDDGSTFVELDAEGQVITLTAPGGVVINGDVTVNGKVDATDDVTADGVSLIHHTHPGVQTGSGDTGEPN